MARSAARRARLAAILAPLCLSLGLAAGYVGFGEAGWLHALEATTLNWRFQLRGPVAPSGEVVLVTIDDDSLATLGRWPPSREALAEAVERLHAAGARTIAFDLLLLEPDADDARFAGSLHAAGDTVLPFAFLYGRGTRPQGPLPIPLARAAFRVVTFEETAPPASVPDASALLTPPAALAEAAATLGHVSLLLDDDGSLRFDHLALAYRDTLFASLPLQAVRLYLDLPSSALIAHQGKGITLGERFIQTDRRLRLPVNFYGPQGTFENYAFADLLAGHIPATAFRDKLVLVGATAVGIGDSFPSPFTQTLPGTEYLATVADNLLSGRILIRHGATAGLDLVTILLAGLAAAVVATHLQPGLAFLGALGLAGLCAAVAYLAFLRVDLWLNLLFPNLAIAANFLWGAGLRTWREQGRRRQVERQRRNLARYFSPAVAEALAERDTPFSFNRMQDAGVLFVDIVGFTRLTCELAPEAAIALLRRFHEIIEAAVFARHGTLDKFIGDGALATFGVPEPSPSDAADALGAAKAIAEEVRAWGTELRADGLQPIEIGIGVHHGPVLMGDIGGRQRFEFTVMGDTVNVASRLESLTRELEVAVIASGAAIHRASKAGAQAETAGFSPLPSRRLRGRPGEVEIWGWSPPTQAKP